MTIRLSTAIDRRQRIRRAVKYVEAILHDRPDARLPVRELADVACMSPYHFIRRYTHAVGESPDANVRRRRLQRSREMLAHDSRASITQVALTLGYENVASFSRRTRSFATRFGCRSITRALAAFVHHRPSSRRLGITAIE